MTHTEYSECTESQYSQSQYSQSQCTEGTMSVMDDAPSEFRTTNSEGPTSVDRALYGKSRFRVPGAGLPGGNRQWPGGASGMQPISESDDNRSDLQSEALHVADRKGQAAALQQTPVSNLRRHILPPPSAAATPSAAGESVADTFSCVRAVMPHVGGRYDVI